MLTGVRRCGKSTLQQLRRRRERGPAVFCNLEDTRLYGLGPADFPDFLSVLDEQYPGASVHLDEVQETREWQRLVRALLDAGRSVCVTGSNASLLGRELGSKLTGRHLSAEVHPFLGVAGLSEGVIVPLPIATPSRILRHIFAWEGLAGAVRSP